MKPVRYDAGEFFHPCAKGLPCARARAPETINHQLSFSVTSQTADPAEPIQMIREDVEKYAYENETLR
jgi:hypothetical protein